MDESTTFARRAERDGYVANTLRVMSRTTELLKCFCNQYPSVESRAHERLMRNVAAS